MLNGNSFPAVKKRRHSSHCCTSLPEVTNCYNPCEEMRIKSPVLTNPSLPYLCRTPQATKPFLSWLSPLPCRAGKGRSRHEGNGHSGDNPVLVANTGGLLQTCMAALFKGRSHFIEGFHIKYLQLL